MHDYNTSAVEGRQEKSATPVPGSAEDLLKGIRMTVTDQGTSVLFGHTPTQKIMLSHM